MVKLSYLRCYQSSIGVGGHYQPGVARNWFLDMWRKCVSIRNTEMLQISWKPIRRLQDSNIYSNTHGQIWIFRHIRELDDYRHFFVARQNKLFSRIFVGGRSIFSRPSYVYVIVWETSCSIKTPQTECL